MNLAIMCYIFRYAQIYMSTSDAYYQGRLWAIFDISDGMLNYAAHITLSPLATAPNPPPPYLLYRASTHVLDAWCLLWGMSDRHCVVNKTYNGYSIIPCRVVVENGFSDIWSHVKRPAVTISRQPNDLPALCAQLRPSGHVLVHL